MLMRCKKLYEARIEVKKILLLIIMQKDQKRSISYLLKRKKPLIYSQQEMTMLRQTLKLTLKLDSTLHLFKDDHKVFKGKFLYRDRD